MHLYVYSLENSEVTGMVNLDFFSYITSVLLINFKNKEYVLVASENKLKVLGQDSEEGDFILNPKENIQFLSK